MFASLSRYEPRVRGILRIVAGLMFLSHGLVKLLGFPEGAPPGQQPPMSLLWAAGLMEIVTGGLITIGWFTRLAALIASGEMAVAYWMVHGSKSIYPVANMGEAAVLYCFLFLYFVTAGPGAWSVDRRK